jgi:hypothetical protein
MKSKTDRADPKRAMDLKENEDPKWTKSNTETEDPMREYPLRAMEEPR